MSSDSPDRSERCGGKPDEPGSVDSGVGPCVPEGCACERIECPGCPDCQPEHPEGMEGRRWTINVCPECGAEWIDLPVDYCPGCSGNGEEPKVQNIEVIPAPQTPQLRELAERLAKQRCAEFPKEEQPSEWNCQRVRADHRENADEYTDESNAEAERLCDSCLARAALRNRRGEA